MSFGSFEMLFLCLVRLLSRTLERMSYFFCLFCLFVEFSVRLRFVGAFYCWTDLAREGFIAGRMIDF